MILIFIYGIPDDAESGKILRLKSILGGIIQGKQKLGLEPSDVLCYAPRERAVTEDGNVLVKAEGLRELSLKRGVGDWEVLIIEKALKEKTREFIKGLRVHCLIA